MHSNITLDTILWFFVALVGTGMIAFLAKGWIKGKQWEREMQLKKRQQRYQ